MIQTNVEFRFVEAAGRLVHEVVSGTWIVGVGGGVEVNQGLSNGVRKTGCASRDFGAVRSLGLPSFRAHRQGVSRSITLKVDVWKLSGVGRHPSRANHIWIHDRRYLDQRTPYHYGSESGIAKWIVGEISIAHGKRRNQSCERECPRAGTSARHRERRKSYLSGWGRRSSRRTDSD